jgi:hypothetical protein
MSKTAINHGFGIVEFPEAIEIDQVFTNNWIKRRRQFSFTDFIQTDDGSLVDLNGKSFKKNTDIRQPLRCFGLANNSTKQDKEFLKSLVNSIHSCLVAYCNYFPTLGRSLWWSTSPSLAIYIEGCGINTHNDNEVSHKGKRTSKAVGTDPYAPVYNVLSASLILKDESDGGEISFCTINQSFKPKPGCLFLYPSGYLGAHSIKPVLSGERVSLLQFFGHGPLYHGTRDLTLYS